MALKELQGAFISINKSQIEFLNPSIKDFIGALIVGSEDYTYDIVVAAVYFDQILRIWQAPSNRMVRSFAGT